MDRTSQTAFGFEWQICLSTAHSFFLSLQQELSSLGPLVITERNVWNDVSKERTEESSWLKHHINSWHFVYAVDSLSRCLLYGPRQGVSRRLAAIDKTKTPPAAVDSKRVIRIAINAENQVTLDGKPATMNEIKQRTMQLVESAGKGHLIQLQSDRNASYDNLSPRTKSVSSGL